MSETTSQQRPHDRRSGFCRETKTYRSLRAPVPLPTEAQPLSFASYAFSLLPSPLPSNPVIVDAATGAAVSYPDFLSQVLVLAASLRSQLGLAKGHVAFVLSPTSLDIPVLYFALLSIGAVVSPANPTSTPDEIFRQFQLTRPAVAFATSSSAHKLPRGVTTVVLDSPRFRSLLSPGPGPAVATADAIWQSDAAAILYSSGTTGRVKGVVLTHRNFLAMVAGYHASSVDREAPLVALFTIPLFHVFGFCALLRAVALGQTIILMGRFEFGAMLRAIEANRVTHIPLPPPLVVAMVKSNEVALHDLSSLKVVWCGGAPLGKEIAERFVVRFPNVAILQRYGTTETPGAATVILGPDEARVHGSVGRLAANMEAKIVDPVSGDSLPPGQPGELWLRGPNIMKGYIGDDEATASTLDSDGWLKTGDLCYFNPDGLLFVVDRLKELIKYKAYQVPPVELEQILQSHPEITDAAVIPYPHDEVGEIPMAFVVRQPGSNLNEEQVIDFVSKQVSPYKKIRRVAFTGSIPKSAAGKILRRELVNFALSGPISKL